MIRNRTRVHGVFDNVTPVTESTIAEPNALHNGPGGAKPSSSEPSQRHIDAGATTRGRGGGDGIADGDGGGDRGATSDHSGGGGDGAGQSSVARGEAGAEEAEHSRDDASDASDASDDGIIICATRTPRTAARKPHEIQAPFRRCVGHDDDDDDDDDDVNPAPPRAAGTPLRPPPAHQQPLSLIDARIGTRVVVRMTTTTTTTWRRGALTRVAPTNADIRYEDGQIESTVFPDADVFVERQEGFPADTGTAATSKAATTAVAAAAPREPVVARMALSRDDAGRARDGTPRKLRDGVGYTQVMRNGVAAFQTQLTYRGTNFYLGTFRTKEAAMRAYDAKAHQLGWCAARAAAHPSSSPAPLRPFAVSSSRVRIGIRRNTRSHVTTPSARLGAFWGALA